MALALLRMPICGRTVLLRRSSSVLRRSYTTTRCLLSSEYPPHTLYPMPALSPTMETGTIASWSIAEGDEFGAGDVLCSIETDKATIDFESQDDGILAKILKEGESARDLAVGVPICVVVEEAEDVAAFANYSAPEEATPQAAPEATAPAPTATTTTTPVDRKVADEHVLMPAARHLSQSKGVDATVLAGSGKDGRVTKGDVLQALANGTHMPALSTATTETATTAAAATAPPPPAAPVEATIPEVSTFGEYNDVPNNNMRKVIARRLTESKSTVPHYYTAMEVELDEVLQLRKELASKHDVKVSVNDLIIRSCALALRDVPEVNASYDPATDKVQLQDSVDVSVAVATPTGLITPIVNNTDQLGLSDISNKIRDLATRARDGALQPHEYQGGTFTVSNLGMFGMDEFSAVINPPQAAILAVGGGSRQVVPTPYVEGAEEQAKPSIKTIMTARLSADRRVVDEATAALFLSAFHHYLSKPQLLLL